MTIRVLQMRPGQFYLLPCLSIQYAKMPKRKLRWGLVFAWADFVIVWIIKEGERT